jgi:hypothetical protein
MPRKPRRPSARADFVLFGIVPCLLGVGFGQYLRWSGAVWLTDAGAFWPIFCLLASLVACVHLARATDYDQTVRTSAWLMLAWTWFYLPFWLTAVDVPRSSAIIDSDGRVTAVSRSVRPGTGTVWMLGGRGGNRFVRNVEGTATISSVDVRYEFAESYISSCHDEEDLSRPVLEAVTAGLAIEAGKPRSSRIALFESKDAQHRFLAAVCSAAVGSTIACPLKLTISPSSASTLRGGLWSKHLTEQEAIAERHLPTLTSLLTQDSARLVRKDAVFALFMEVAVTAAELAGVARKPQLLDDRQFDALIARILVAPAAGNDALSLAASESRLAPDQREALRAKALREADVAEIIKQLGPGRIADPVIAELAPRLRLAFDATPEVAVLALETFGGRLPADLQSGAVAAIARAPAAHALAALRHLDFASPLRAVLVRKVIAEASLKELDASLAQGRIEALLTPAEARPLIASVIARSHTSREWLDFAVRVLPARAMTAEEREAIVDQLMFVSAKSALEFVSENRQHLLASVVRDVTRDYARTIAPDFCLHLTHRNANRQIDYFDEAQLEIFRACAQSK